MKKKKLPNETIVLSELDTFAYQMMFKYSRMNLPYNVYTDKVNAAINKKARQLALEKTK